MVDIENKHELRSRKRYFFMIYCIAVLFVWPLGLFWMISNEYIEYITIYILVMTPLELVAMLMILSLAISPFKYSIFGPYKHTPFPNEMPLLEISTGGKISSVQVSGPLIKYIVYPSGLGISILGTGKTFIPTRYITDIKPHFLNRYKLKHNSPELRNPVIFNSMELYEALQKLRGVYETTRP
uniref:Uncharacterized protein n=1 Tax=Candidatus Methanogaster sp. ANME-2c ERB4 TaxID=2759911 RepID=A0A7G9YI78_9EURY|nr:hypothetical protein LDJELIEA_00010 [Methanosarcinales archaeon ANME-2c ERB4]